MDGTIQAYVLDMAADTKKEPLRVKQYDTNSRWARVTLKMGGEPWTIPFGCQIHINVRKTDGKLADATCTRIDEHTVLAPITEQMTAVTGTQLGELYFLGSDGDIKTQTFPVVVYEAVMDQAQIESSDDFQSLKDALRDVKVSTEAADNAAQYATEQGNAARDGAQRANDAADSIQVAVDAAAAAKDCESNAKDSELAAAQTQQEVTDYVEAQKAAFVGYSKRESDSRYANALTATATGEGGVTVEDAWTAPVLGLDVAGKSEQVVTTGANLFDIVHADNIKGVASGDELYYARVGQNSAWVESTKIPFAGESSTIYTLSAKVKCGTATNLGIAFCYSDGTFEMSNRVNDATYGEVKVTSKADKIVNGFGFIYVSADTSGYIKDIQLQKGSTATAYEPYTGGAPSPSPDYPQDIISTGTVSTGAQLLNADTIVQGMVNADTGELSSSSIAVSSDYIEVRPGNYFLSGEGLKPYMNRVVFYDVEKAYISSDSVYAKNGLIIVPETAAYMRLRFVGTENLIPANIKALKPMLNAGDTALSWEPYTGGKPAPSEEYPQVINVRAQGVQLFDASGLNDYDEATHKIEEDGKKITIIGNSNTNNPRCDIRFIRSNDIGNFLGKKLYISGEITSGDDTSTVSISSFNGVTFRELRVQTNIGKFHNIEYAVPEDAIEILLVLRPKKNMAVFTDIMVSPVSLNEGVWEPYRVPQTVPIQLTEPLRGIGVYRDRIMCKDGIWGIERQTHKMEFDGSQDEVWAVQSVNDNGITNYMYYLKIIGRKNINALLCNRLQYDSSWIAGATRNGVLIGNGTTLYIRLKEVKTLDNFRKWLTENPLIIVYPLAVSAWEPLPDATQQALNELTTYAGTTHLTITAGGPAPTVTLDYVKDTHKALEQCQEAAKEYTDSQIAAIVAALPTATQAAIVDNQTTRLLQEV